MKQGYSYHTYYMDGKFGSVDLGTPWVFVIYLVLLICLTGTLRSLPGLRACALNTLAASQKRARLIVLVVRTGTSYIAK